LADLLGIEEAEDDRIDEEDDDDAAVFIDVCVLGFAFGFTDAFAF